MVNNLEWNNRYSDFIKFVMKGILKPVRLVGFDTNQGASRMDPMTLDWNIWPLQVPTLLKR